MEERNVYQDISRRTDGDVYIGVVGPVRKQYLHRCYRCGKNGKVNIYKKVYGFACPAQYP